MNYLYLFFISLLASTLLPISSEVSLLYYLQEGDNIIILLVSAGVGNTLGSIINYFIGKKGIELLVKNKNISPKRLHQTHKIFDKYGGYSLLLSWLPIIGDPITLIAGALKYDLKKFIFIVMVAKFGRYGIIILSYYNFMLL